MTEMPTYDYVCQACGHEFELFQQMSDPVKRKCPACTKPKLRRRVGSGAGILFRGGGFHETDYRSESYKKAAEADKKAAEGKAKKKKKKEGTRDEGRGTKPKEGTRDEGRGTRSEKKGKGNTS